LMGFCLSAGVSWLPNLRSHSMYMTNPVEARDYGAIIRHRDGLGRSLDLRLAIGLNSRAHHPVPAYFVQSAEIAA
jgi:hypothetical protein